MDVIQGAPTTVAWQEVGDGLQLGGLRGTEPGAGTAFLRFAPGAISGLHRHPEGEELFVVSGRIRVGERELRAGDYLYTPPGGIHDAEAHDDTLLLISVPKAIEFL